MLHARKDYDRIQDPAGLIPEDEPVFLIRGQDKHAYHALRMYAALVETAGGDEAIVEAVKRQAERMRVWPKKHAPDVPPADVR